MEKVWTGERLETFIFNATSIEHLHRYALACDICKNKYVLDIASGEGYGSNLLSLVAGNVIGVDISNQAVEEAAEKYQRSNLSFRQGSASKIPVDDNSIDVVVSFETIEHHDKHEEMLQEILRVLKPDGILLMSSPDKKFYSDVPGYNNPFHVKELYFDEFKRLIKSYFQNTHFFFQKIVTGSLVIPENPSTEFKQFEGDYNSIEATNGFSPVYNLCVASNHLLPNLNSSLFDGRPMYEYERDLAIKTRVKAVKEEAKKAVENAVKHAEETVRKTWSYKTGNLILFPLKLFKKG